MTRKRRTSATLDKAMARISGMRTVDATMDLGNGLSLAEYEAQFKSVQDELLNYNTMLASIDAIAEQVNIKEAALRAYSERMLMGVTLRYGRGSFEYLQAGGKLRKVPSKRSKPNANPAMTPDANPAMTSSAIAALMNGSAIVPPTGNAVTASMN